MELYIQEPSWAISVTSPEQLTSRTGQLDDALRKIIHDVTDRSDLQTAVEEALVALSYELQEVTNHDILELKTDLSIPRYSHASPRTIAQVIEHALAELTSNCPQTADRALIQT